MTDIGANETERARVAARYCDARIFDDRVFEDAVRLAASIAGVGMAAITLLDATHLWFVAETDGRTDRIEKGDTFCQQTVATNGRFIVKDALEDPAFKDCDFVTAKNKIRYYAGLPMLSRCGHVIGALCVADSRPNRTVTDEQFRHLALLLEITVDRLEQRCAAVDRERALDRVREVSRAIGQEAISLSIEGERLTIAATAHERATAAAMQGVRSIVHLDREIHDTLTGSPRRGVATRRIIGLPEAVRDQISLHNLVSLTAEDELDVLVGTASALRARSCVIEGQGQRLIDLSSVLDDAVMVGPGAD